MAADNIVIVGYRLKPAFSAERLRELMPVFQANRTFKDPVKISEDIAGKELDWLASASMATPYLSTFDEIYISRPKRERTWRGVASDRGPGTGKQPLSLAAAGWLLKEFSEWSFDLSGPGRSPAIFVGFNPRLFLKVLGIECSLPQVGRPLPPSMWYGSSDHYRDIQEAVIPSGFESAVTLKTVLALRQPVNPEDAAAWEKFKTWTYPGRDPQLDSLLATELAVQLGFLN